MGRTKQQKVAFGTICIDGEGNVYAYRDIPQPDNSTQSFCPKGTQIMTFLDIPKSHLNMKNGECRELTLVIGKKVCDQKDWRNRKV